MLLGGGGRWAYPYPELDGGDGTCGARTLLRERSRVPDLDLDLERDERSSGRNDMSARGLVTTGVLLTVLLSDYEITKPAASIR